MVYRASGALSDKLSFVFAVDGRHTRCYGGIALVDGERIGEASSLRRVMTSGMDIETRMNSRTACTALPIEAASPEFLSERNEHRCGIPCLFQFNETRLAKCSWVTPPCPGTLGLPR